MDQIQHDVVSSNVLYKDGTGIIHLQVFAGNAVSSTTVVTTAPQSTCVEYQIAGTTLQRRTKAPATAVWTGTWSTVITGVVISTQNRSLQVTLWVKADTRTVNAASPALFTTTVTGRAIPNNPSPTTGAC
jgi:hypothetical protein